MTKMISFAVPFQQSGLEDLFEKITNDQSIINVSWENETDLHITVGLIYDIEEEHLSKVLDVLDIADNMSTVNGHVAEAALYSGYLVLEITMDDDHLHEYRNQLEQKLFRDTGLTFYNRYEYSPHVSLANLRDLSLEEQLAVLDAVNNIIQQNYSPITISEIDAFRPADPLAGEETKYVSISSHEFSDAKHPIPAHVCSHIAQQAMIEETAAFTGGDTSSVSSGKGMHDHHHHAVANNIMLAAAHV